MIPYPYKFVDFAGTDLSEINGLVVEGIYQRIIDALNSCGEVVLYNWYFASIPVAPSYCSIEVRTDYIMVNEIIEIRDDDTVWVESLIPPEPEPPPPPVLVQLTALSNGQYFPESYDADGFSEVNVLVPSSGFVRSGTTVPDSSLGQDEDLYVQYEQLVNADYEYGIVAIFRKVSSVWEPYVDPEYLDKAVRVWTESTSGTNASINVQNGRYINNQFVPSGDAVNVLYTSVQSGRSIDLFRMVNLSYPGTWTLKALEAVEYDGNTYVSGSTIRTWGYNTSVDFVVKKAT